MEKTPPDMKVRLSADLRRKIADAAQENNRTLNSEIVFRLEASFRDGMNPPALAIDQASEIETLRARVEALESKLNAIPADQLEAFTKLMLGLKQGEIVTLAQGKRRQKEG